MVRVLGPSGELLKGGMISFTVDGVESADIQRHLSRVANVRTRVIGEYSFGWMRLSTHVYNAPGEIERVLELLATVARNGIPA